MQNIIICSCCDRRQHGRGIRAHMDGLQRVSAKVCHSCLGLCGQLNSLRMSHLRAVVCKVNGTVMITYLSSDTI